MTRRIFVMFGMFAALTCSSPFASALADDKIHHIGILSPSAGVAGMMRSIVVPELAKFGFIEGKNLAIEARIGEIEQLPMLARELVSTNPEVVIAVAAISARAVKAAASSVPIVVSFIGEDPIAAGFAKSLAHPGGTITGIVMLAPELDAKRLHLLLELAPGAKRIAALAVDPKRDAPNLAAMSEIAGRSGITLMPFYAKHDEYRATFEAMHNAGVDAVQLVSAPELFADVSLLATLAVEAKLPTMCEWRAMAVEGCLVGYGPNFAELQRRVAYFVARILQGAAPGELPIEGPTRYEFSVNLKTAKALNFTIPPSIFARADDVIE